VRETTFFNICGRVGGLILVSRYFVIDNIIWIYRLFIQIVMLASDNETVYISYISYMCIISNYSN